MRLLPVLVILCFSSWAATASAALTINEVAWMGGSVSANHEWIELYNDGVSSVGVDGYTLTDNQNLNISLTGVIAPASFAVLERTSEESAPGAAFLIYTGALVNTGATLTLRDQSGGIVDQVVGGEDWQNIGGDNVTKETAQYTTSGWRTSTPTPGEANIGAGEAIVNPPETSPGDTQSSGNIVSGESKSKVVLNRDKKSALSLDFQVPKQVYVNQPIDFAVTADGSGETIISSLRYAWNFGDARAERGRTVTHSYDYPGTYVVTVRAQYAGRDVLARQEITVLPVVFSLSRSSSGDVQINNDAQYEIDISLYTLKGEKTLLIPKDTILLPRSTITIPREKIENGGVRSYVILYDALKQPVAHEVPSLLASAKVVQNQPLAQATNLQTTANRQAGSVMAEETETTRSPLQRLLPEAEAAEALDDGGTQPEEGPSQENKYWPYLLLVILILGATMAIWYGPKSSTVEA